MSEARKAKYCPECGTMALVDAPVCATCGHQFHTGVVPMEAVIRPEDDDEFNKTQLFMMSQVLMQRPPTPVAPVPVGEDAPAAPGVKSRWRIVLAAGIAIVVVGLIAGGILLNRPPDAHPAAVVGRWARATDRGTVGLMFAADGSGALFWQPAPGIGAGGNVLLHWNQTPQRKLKLGAAQAVIGGPEVQQSVALLASHPWTWDADAHQLTLGQLTFIRQ